MANKNYNGTPPKYINDFSKALAGEVRILLAEVGKLRDERRALQHEISELMSVRSKYGGGGEYNADWHPNAPPAIEAPPDLPAIEAGPVAPAPPAWRTVHKRPAKRDRNARGNTASPAPIAAIEPPKPEMPAWAQWRPNPLLAPIASPAPQSPAPAERRGLFGPPTPPPGK